MKYNPNEIDAKWQKHMKMKFKTKENNMMKPKYYVLDMFHIHLEQACRASARVYPLMCLLDIKDTRV
jgi:carbonic anhydrase